MEQTIAAIATPPGTGGIAIVRLSGPQSHEVAQRVFVPRRAGVQWDSIPGYTALFGDFVLHGQPADEGIALFFRAPHSYTGEDVVELSCHGGSAISRLLLQGCFDGGAVPAAPGEYTKRAYLNGRIDLAQAEAVMEMISASGDTAAKLAQNGLSGALYRKIEPIRQGLLSLAGHLAAYVDYPEEDVEVLETDIFIGTLRRAQNQLAQWMDNYQKGAVVRRGVRVALVGSPNVGKSTLFNLLSGYERAIVTPVAGTTRDVVREQIQVGGIPLLLSDTAGLHEVEDIVECEGIKRSYDEIEQVDIILAVFDGSKPFEQGPTDWLASFGNKPSVAILNKSDLGTAVQPEQLAPYFNDVVVVSALQPGEALPVLEQAILRALELPGLDPDTLLLSNQRQYTAAAAAAAALMQSAEALAAGQPIDIAGVFLDEALAALSELTGENVADAVVADVFARFCVGK